MLDVLRKNWPLKLLALVLAFAAWVAITGDVRIVQDFRVPLDVHLPPDLIPEESAPTTVNVRLRGPESLVRKIDPLPLKVDLDLENAVPGARSVQLSSENLKGLPTGVEVALIEPDRFRIVLERRLKRVLPVVPALTGKPASGYAVYDVHITPETLEVDGPESTVAALTRLRTDPIHLDGRTGPFTVRVGAVPSSLEVRVLDARPLEARVEIDAAPATAAFERVPVVFAGQAHEATASPPALTVTLTAPPALLGTIRPGQLRAVVDLTGIEPRPEPYTLPVRIEFLEMAARDLGRVSVKSVSRSTVVVRLSDRRASR